MADRATETGGRTERDGYTRSGGQTLADRDRQTERDGHTRVGGQTLADRESKGRTERRKHKKGATDTG